MAKLTMNVGDKAVVLTEMCDESLEVTHGFPKNTIVTIDVKHDDDTDDAHYRCSASDGDYWWLKEHELKPIKP